MNRIMIIEDDPNFRTTLSNLLCERYPTLDLKEVESGEEAMAILHVFSPDLVVTDIKLPGESGLRVTQRIREAIPNVPVLVLTSYNDLEYEEAAYAAGATRFASKHETTADEILWLVDSLMPETFRKS